MSGDENLSLVNPAVSRIIESVYQGINAQFDTNGSLYSDRTKAFKAECDELLNQLDASSSISDRILATWGVDGNTEKPIAKSGITAKIYWDQRGQRYITAFFAPNSMLPSAVVITSGNKYMAQGKNTVIQVIVEANRTNGRYFEETTPSFRSKRDPISRETPALYKAAELTVGQACRTLNQQVGLSSIGPRYVDAHQDEYLPGDVSWQSVVKTGRWRELGTPKNTQPVSSTIKE